MGTEEFIIELFSEGPIDTASEDDMFKVCHHFSTIVTLLIHITKL